MVDSKTSSDSCDFLDGIFEKKALISRTTDHSSPKLSSFHSVSSLCSSGNLLFLILARKLLWFPLIITTVLRFDTRRFISFKTKRYEATSVVLVVLRMIHRTTVETFDFKGNKRMCAKYIAKRMCENSIIASCSSSAQDGLTLVYFSHSARFQYSITE